MKTRMFALLVALVAVAFSTAGPAIAQSFSLGADVVNRYVWRGTDFGESASIQPALSFSYGGFEIGTWASYAIDPTSAGVNEHDLWLSFTTGMFTVGLTDYYFPNAGAGFFNFDGEGAGAHWIEPFVSVTGPEAFPMTVFAGYFVHNDPDRSLYLSADYPFAIDGVDLSVGAGASAGRSALYGTDGFGIVALRLGASRSVTLTESFSLPLSVAYILNPSLEQSYLVFGLSL